MKEVDVRTMRDADTAEFSAIEAAAPYFGDRHLEGEEARVPSRATAAFRGLFILIAFVIITMLAVKFASPGEGVRIGQRAPDFTLTTFEGDTFRLSNLRGRPVVLNFWASWCGPCRTEAPLLESAWQAGENQEIMFLGVSSSDRDAPARAFVREYGITYPNALDTDNTVADLYVVDAFPSTFLIDADGVIKGQIIGAIPNAAVLDERLGAIRSAN